MTQASKPRLRRRDGPRPIPIGVEQTHTPTRRCIATGELRPKSTLLRFVIDPGGRLVPDIAERLPGRGLWLSADPEHVALACRKGLFARAARRAVVVPEDLLDQITGLLAKRLCDFLGLANKAGLVRTGFVKASEAIAGGEAKAVVIAQDAARHGRDKIARLVQQAQIATISVLSAEEMGLALGRENVVHAALRAGAITDRLREVAGRLAVFRASDVAGGSTSTDGSRLSKSNHDVKCLVDRGPDG